jgi:ATP-dependent Clp protease adapter protein ClpS
MNFIQNDLSFEFDLASKNKNNFLIENISTLEEVEDDVDVIDVVQNACKVLLFNDEWHTFDEVINQIIKAVQCSYNHAEKLTLQVHEKGRALVYSGELAECLKVSSILEEIALHTQIEM